LIFSTILKTPFKLTHDRQEFSDYTGAKISYGMQPMGNELFIQMRDLVFEHGIIEHDIVAIPFQHTKAIFPVNSEKSVLPFDVFAATFFMASRYEEYLPHKRDEHDRFDAKESIAYEFDFVHQPVVNIWTEALWVKLKESHPNIERTSRKFTMITTIDVDNAFKFKQKGAVRTVAGITKDLVSFDFSGLIHRLKVLAGKEQDPYDTFEYQLSLIKKHKLRFIYFFLLGDYGVNDKNIPVTSLKFQSLIKSLADYAEVGIHPSYGSNKSFDQLQKEISRLSHITNLEITKSRQHFLKVKLPETYRNLLDLDITDEYTMGYADLIGFRSGICVPFTFYDLDLEVETQLWIHPFAAMEGTLKYYMDVSLESAFGYYKRLMDEVYAVQGEFITLWHNDTINNQGAWKGWQGLFERIIEYGLELESKA
jgi:hypothetical protein